MAAPTELGKLKVMLSCLS